MDSVLLGFFAVILLFGIGIFVLIVTRGRTTSVLDVDKFRSSLLSIEQKLNKEQPDSYVLAILNADKLVDLALKQSGFKGQTMGERMRSAQSKWSDPNKIWSAHKLRNQLAHEHDTRVSYDQARYALAQFRQALRDLGAI